MEGKPRSNVGRRASGDTFPVEEAARTHKDGGVELRGRELGETEFGGDDGRVGPEKLAGRGVKGLAGGETGELDVDGGGALDAYLAMLGKAFVNPGDHVDDASGQEVGSALRNAVLSVVLTLDGVGGGGVERVGDEIVHLSRVGVGQDVEGVAWLQGLETFEEGGDVGSIERANPCRDSVGVHRIEDDDERCSNWGC